jgi:hypothetical protein
MWVDCRQASETLVLTRADIPSYNGAGEYQMPSHSIKTDLQDFVQFAMRRIGCGDCGASVEDLVQQWRSDSEFAATVSDVRQGLMDDAGGRAESATDAFAEVRRQLGIAE